MNDRIPSRAECGELMAKYSMLPNIIDHSLQVMNVSLAIVDNLQRGVLLNRALVIAAALLHDITKTQSLTTRENHAVSGGMLLRDLGLSRTAEIVEQHVRIKNLNVQGPLEEKEIVFYADKRVCHDTIVTLEERVQDLLKRYATTEEIRDQILRNKTQALVVERKIAGFLEVDILQDICERADRNGKHCGEG